MYKIHQNRRKIGFPIIRWVVIALWMDRKEIGE